MTKKIGRPNELKASLDKAKHYLNGDYKTVGDVVPSVTGLACYLKKSRSTIYDYANKNSEFSDTLEMIKSVQENMLINGGLRGEFNSNITKLMLANHGYTDKKNLDIQSSNGSMSLKQTKDLTDAELEAELAKYGIKKTLGSS